MATVEVLPDPAALARAAARRFVDVGRDAIAARGRFAVALSGGNTPHATYRELAGGAGAALDWARTHVFWSDERCVPPADADSNYAAAKALLLDRVPLPAGNIHRIEGEREPDAAASSYERSLAAFFSASLPGPPRFDLILLGLGTDGHTASIFPGTVATNVLAPEHLDRWVLAVQAANRPAWRITMTPRLINASAEVLLLAFGLDKAAVVRDLLARSRPVESLPAQLIEPAAGQLTYYFDAGAAPRARFAS